MSKQSGWYLTLAFVLVLGGCTTTQQQRRHRVIAPKPRMVVQPKPRAVRPVKPVQPKQPSTPAFPTTKRDVATLFQTFGNLVMRQGEFVRQRHMHLHQFCNRPGASSAVCRIYRRSQRIFAYNYRTKASNYRGYLLYHWRNKRRVPRWLRRWHRRMAGAKYKGKGGRCYVADGLATSCMGFAMCAQRMAMSRFSGPWGKGFSYPTWGYVNYWTNRAFLSVYNDYQKAGKRRPGIRTLRQKEGVWPAALLHRAQRRLLKDMYASFMRIVRRKLRNRWNRRLYRKLFCTNVVADVGSLKRGVPGDLFAISYAQKRSLRGQMTGLRFQHWGLMAAPKRGLVLHNQTPGGLWRRKFARWGVQYGTYKTSFLKKPWTYRRRKRRYEARRFFLNRLNVHYFLYARHMKQEIYHSREPALCERWMASYGHLYFLNVPSVSTTVQPFLPPLSTQPQLVSRLSSRVP
jgi:hypothetical protein